MQNYGPTPPSTSIGAFFEQLFGITLMLLLGLAPVLALASGSIGAVLALPLTYCMFKMLPMAVKQGRRKTEAQHTEAARQRRNNP
jgi:multisubunit Na+/H+ antiporter MnhB subunit